MITVENKIINIPNGRDGTYEVDLDRCKTAAECLDWIHQLHVKAWNNPQLEWEFIGILLKEIPATLWSGAGFGQDDESKLREENKRIRNVLRGGEMTRIEELERRIEIKRQLIDITISEIAELQMLIIELKSHDSTV